MKSTLQHPTWGEIVYDESIWTGKKTIAVNGVPLQKQSKKEFIDPSGGLWVVKGNYLSGTVLETGGEAIRMTAPVKWYEIVLSVIPFLLVMVWGNVAALCAIVPVVGGAIGGVISAVCSVLNLYIIKGIQNIWLKILISIGFIAAAFLVCFLIGFAILSVAA